MVITLSSSPPLCPLLTSQENLIQILSTVSTIYSAWSDDRCIVSPVGPRENVAHFPRSSVDRSLYFVWCPFHNPTPVLRLERNTLSMVKSLRQAPHKYAPLPSVSCGGGSISRFEMNLSTVAFTSSGNGYSLPPPLIPPSRFLSSCLRPLRSTPWWYRCG